MNSDKNIERQPESHTERDFYTLEVNDYIYIGHTLSVCIHREIGGHMHIQVGYIDTFNVKKKINIYYHEHCCALI